MAINYTLYDNRDLVSLIYIGLPLYLEAWKNLEFDNLDKKTKKPRNFNSFFSILNSEISI